jgi:hypothetical protein
LLLLAAFLKRCSESIQNEFAVFPRAVPRDIQARPGPRLHRPAIRAREGMIFCRLLPSAGGNRPGLGFGSPSRVERAAIPA